MQVGDVVTHFRAEELGNTTEDVRKVLSYVGKPGEHRDIKLAAIRKLFTQTSPQGFTTADTIESYEEY